jgi:hypothetical protein
LNEVIDNVVVVQLDKLTAKHVLPGFTDRSFEERQIEALTAEITQVRFVALINHNLGLTLLTDESSSIRDSANANS